MIKKASILAFVACLFLAILSSGLVQAQSELTILDNSAQVEFPSKLSFNLLAENDVNITDIRLHYTVDRVSLAHVTSEVCIELVPATTVDAECREHYIESQVGLVTIRCACGEIFYITFESEYNNPPKRHLWTPPNKPKHATPVVMKYTSKLKHAPTAANGKAPTASLIHHGYSYPFFSPSHLASLSPLKTSTWNQSIPSLLKPTPVNHTQIR